ncbi:ATP-binding cassette domain-containing protein [Geomicrobium sp. JCM 19038]|uniref:ATP-binding cassette domain-containing protein n=1 Tax=Geomicrobium sp. JCM 19038 TaxID=1460635 RepID=UPI00045F126A|nr:ATP-binding cassette domain-containing protein [Geomicrobium sp. JCM 19038]GAK07792.1 oligopeptide transport ATP-binding protein OppD [Geomicrobium sp. JCM 19038]
MIEVNNLAVKTETQTLLEPLSFRIQKGESIGVLGESGAGKTMLTMALLQLLSSPLQVEGSVIVHDQHLNVLSNEQLRSVRGNTLGYVPQNVQAIFDPYRKIGVQMVEAIRAHERTTKREAKRTAMASLREVQLKDEHYHFFPFQLSGGMLQRAGIALVFSLQPELVIADEPTTALDEETKTLILELLLRKQREEGLSILFVSHEIDVIKKMVTRILVLENGKCVECGSVDQLMNEPSSARLQSFLHYEAVLRRGAMKND